MTEYRAIAFGTLVENLNELNRDGERELRETAARSDRRSDAASRQLALDVDPKHEEK